MAASTSQHTQRETPNHMDPALYKALMNCKVDQLDPNLVCKVDQLTPNHNTILHVAAHFGNNECVSKILEKKPKLIGQLNKNDENPIHIAVRNHHDETVKALINCASNLHQDPESGGGTLLQMLTAENKDGEIPLFLAAERSDGDRMVEYILASGSPVDTGPSGRTALHAAATSGNRESIKKLLVGHKELIYKADAQGWTPLHRAAAANHDTVMEEILSHCPDCWEMVNDKGQNILHIALHRKAQCVIDYIIKTHMWTSLVNQKDNEDNTPRHLLTSPEMKDMNDFIRPRIANMYAVNNKNETPVEEAKMITEDKAKAKKNTSQIHMLVATIIATITFAAGFTIPGGYQSQGPEEGLAVLMRKAGFRVFVIANTIAVMCSTSSVLTYAVATLYKDDKKKAICYMKGFGLVLIAIIAMTLGFISGTYAMLVHSHGVTIATSVIAIIWLFIYLIEPKWFASYINCFKGNN